MKKNLTKATLMLTGFVCLAGAGWPIRAQERQTIPPDMYQLQKPRFFFNGKFLNMKDLPKGDTIMVAGATKDRDVVYVFVNKEEFLRWAKQTDQGDVLVRATREMDERGAKKDEREFKRPEMKQHWMSRLPKAATSMVPAGPGWLYNGYNYSGTSRPLVTYPLLSWVSLNNKVSSVWTVGLTILCDYTWFGGSKVYLLAIGIPDLNVFKFDNRASSVL
jgi:hypothetical protein